MISPRMSLRDRIRRYGLLAGLVLLMTLVEFLVFNRQYVAQRFSSLEQRRLLVKDGILNQLRDEKGILISQGTDPSITFEQLNRQINAFSIACDSSIATASGQVFYRSDNQPFSAQNSILYKPSLDGNKIILSLPKTQFVSDLKIDLTNRQGDIITCREFVINPVLQFDLAITRFTLYLCVTALAIFELFKGVNLRGKSLVRSGYLSRMWSKIAPVLRNKKTLLLSLGWIMLWMLPGAAWLDALPWLRIGLSLMLFLTPGLTLSLLLARERFSLPAHFSAGLALSVFWVGALGFTGRVLHWPFEYLKILFALSGLISLLALLRYSTSNRPLYKPTGWSGRTIILLLFMTAFGILANFHSRHSVDDLSYLAYLTTWQHAEQLDFREVIYGVGTADSIRFWWGMFPMSLALLAELSHMHGLLLVGFYLEPFLVTFALLAIYVLYQDLLPSQDQAITALLMQFTFLFLIRQQHRFFFEHLSEDKVFAAFVLAPVFFLALRNLLGSFDWRSGLLFLLIGSSLALTHPIILAYAVFIAGFSAAIETIRNKEYARLGIVTLLLLLILAPSASLRFVDEAWVSESILGLEPGLAMSDTFNLDAVRDSFEIDNLISYIDGTPFYGFDLDRIRIVANRAPQHPLMIFLSWSYLWILGLGFLWSLFNLKKDKAAPFIAAASLLLLLCAIPYTGWLVGYFVSARMLWRAPWLLPTGLISFILLRELFGVLIYIFSKHNWINRQGKQVLLIGSTLLCLVLTGYYSEEVYQYQGQSSKAQLDGYGDHLSRLVNLGRYLESRTEQPARFAAPAELMNYLPGIASTSKAVIFRVKDWTPYPVDEDEISSLFSHNISISVEQRMRVLEKYQIQYVLVEQPSIGKYYAGYPQYFELQYIDGYWLFEYLAYHGNGNN